MLVLQRKKGDSLMIGDDITIGISEMGADWVKLAVDAPPDIRIIRSELLEAAGMNQEASQVNEAGLMQLRSLITGRINK